MSKFSTNFTRAAGIVEFFLEDSTHTIEDASKEFEVNRSTVGRDLDCYAREAFYSNRPNKIELQKKYVKVKKQLANNSKVARLKKA